MKGIHIKKIFVTKYYLRNIKINTFQIAFFITSNLNDLLCFTIYTNILKIERKNI